MKKTLFRLILILTALAVLTTAAPAALAEAADSANDIRNMLVIAGEDMGDGYFPLLVLVFSADFTEKTIKVINFYYTTQVNAVAKNGEAVSIPMSLLPVCDDTEIVKAFENTFGIPIERYLIYVYKSNSYEPFLDVFDQVDPITVDIPEEVLGTAQHSTVNGNMKAIAGASKREYTPIQSAGLQELNGVGILSYYTAIPARIWASGDTFTNVMEDYKYWDNKNAVLFSALRAIIGMMGPDASAAILRTLLTGQDTDMTDEQIAIISGAGLNFAPGVCYMTVPGFEGVEMVVGDTGTLKGVSTFQKQMLTYDSEAIRQQIHTFLYGD